MMADKKSPIDELLNYTAEELATRMKIELVWENASPTSTFTAQNVWNEKFKTADIIAIEARNLATLYGKNIFYVSRTDEDNGAAMVINFASFNNAGSNIMNLYRQANFDAVQGRVLLSAAYNTSTSQSYINNNACIPFRIYTIKFGKEE